MDYKQLRGAWHGRNMIFEDHNGADATGNDNSTDPVITRDPNNYLLPKVSSITLIHGLTIAILVLGIIVLLPMAIQKVKSYVTN